MLKISYNANGLRCLSVHHAIAAVAAAGYDAIELSLHAAHLDPLTVTPAELQQVKRSLTEHDLAACCLAAGADRLLGPERFEPSLIHPTAAGRERRIDLIRRAIDIAQELSIPIVNFASGVRKPEVSPGAAWDLLQQGVARCVEHAAGKVTLAIEPEPGFFIGTNDSAELLIRRLGRTALRINQDIGHVMVAEPNFLESIERRLPLTAHIHVEDIRDRVHAHLIPGEGDIDFPSFTERLQESSYSGFISVELYDHNDRYLEALSTSLQFLRRLSQKTGARS